MPCLQRIHARGASPLHRLQQRGRHVLGARSPRSPCCTCLRDESTAAGTLHSRARSHQQAPSLRRWLTQHPNPRTRRSVLHSLCMRSTPATRKRVQSRPPASQVAAGRSVVHQRRVEQADGGGVVRPHGQRRMVRLRPHARRGRKEARKEVPRQAWLKEGWAVHAASRALSSHRRRGLELVLRDGVRCRQGAAAMPPSLSKCAQPSKRAPHPPSKRCAPHLDGLAGVALQLAAQAQRAQRAGLPRRQAQRHAVPLRRAFRRRKAHTHTQALAWASPTGPPRAAFTPALAHTRAPPLEKRGVGSARRGAPLPPRPGRPAAAGCAPAPPRWAPTEAPARPAGRGPRDAAGRPAPRRPLPSRRGTVQPAAHGQPARAGAVRTALRACRRLQSR